MVVRSLGQQYQSYDVDRCSAPVPGPPKSLVARSLVLGSIARIALVDKESLKGSWPRSLRRSSLSLWSSSAGVGMHSGEAATD